MKSSILPILYHFAIATVLSMTLAACGVRGAPQPPLTPPELGRGQPTFKRATEGFAFPDVPSPYVVPEPTPTPAQGEKKQ